MYIGIANIVLGIAAFYVREQLHSFKKKGPDIYLGYLVTSSAVNLVYIYALIDIVEISNVYMLSAVGIQIVAYVSLIAVNYIYFNKRKFLFAN